MGWKDFKPWLRGGIIGLGFGILLSIIIPMGTAIAIMVIGHFLGFGAENQGYFKVIIDYIVLMIPFFLTGALIGWITGRRKSSVILH